MRVQRIIYSSYFLRSLKKLPPDQKELVRERQGIFEQNCFDPRLKTHKLSGKLKDFWSFSLTHSHRVLFRFQKNGDVEFLNVGNHSIYK